MEAILLHSTTRLKFVVEIIGCNVLYLTDYQGNISGVVNTATKELEQYQDYYPYSKPYDTAVDVSDKQNQLAWKYL